MPRFAANLTMMFTEVGFIDRFAAAAAAGFKGVEYLFPYAFAKEAVADALAANGLEQVLHNLPAGDWDNGERGIAGIPGREGEFQDGVGRAIEYATALGCSRLNCLVGVTPAGVDPDKIDETLVTNLRFASRSLSDAGIKLLFEPINRFDIPGFHIATTAEALSLFDRVGEANLWLQYDIYHMQRMEGELTATIAATFDRIAHIQLADNPGRHEPGTGEINYPFIFRELDRLGYAGWVGCEYKPKAGTVEGLGWLDAIA